MSRFSRRDFLKLGSVLSGAAALSRLAPRPARTTAAATEKPNMVVFVFDAMTAKNLSIYGYKRKTTPNFERFAQRATVYNQHYSTANFTTAGTASLLTGVYPWTHRAFNQSALIARTITRHNMFEGVGKEYYRLAFSQNLWANYFFGQFGADIEKVLSPGAFSLVEEIAGDRFPNDRAFSQRAYDEFMFEEGRPPVSLVFGLIERIALRRAVARISEGDYLRGIPRTGYYPIFFTVKDVVSGMAATIEGLNTPSLAYLHAWAPHAPYRPNKQFDHAFLDGWRPKPKPEHLLGRRVSQKHMNERRQNYDEYVANVDFEFGRMLDSFEAKGILDNSYVIVTSDHGEMFERGVEGHGTYLLYDPLVRVPLLISAPGQTTRRDVHVPTSSTDVLPTLVHLSGGQAPAWGEGQILPGLGGQEQPDRSIFMMEAKQNRAYLPLTRASFAMRKGPHKLIYYKGLPEYEGRDRFELYDIDNDPEELNDLYQESSADAQALRTEMLGRVEAENARFRPG